MSLVRGVIMVDLLSKRKFLRNNISPTWYTHYWNGLWYHCPGYKFSNFGSDNHGVTIDDSIGAEVESDVGISKLQYIRSDIRPTTD